MSSAHSATQLTKLKSGGLLLLRRRTPLTRRPVAYFHSGAHTCNFIRDNQLPGPLFNTYAWGGFLIWYLPEYPVSIDGRLSLYGNEANEGYFNLVAGTERFEKTPSFVRARTLLLEQNSGVAKALTTLPALRQQFQVAYQDDLAVVLVRQ
jgi:hypothetical protein